MDAANFEKQIKDLIGKKVTEINRVNTGLIDEGVDVVFDDEFVLTFWANKIPDGGVVTYRKRNHLAVNSYISNSSWLEDAFRLSVLGERLSDLKLIREYIKSNPATEEIYNLFVMVTYFDGKNVDDLLSDDLYRLSCAIIQFSQAAAGDEFSIEFIKSVLLMLQHDYKTFDCIGENNLSVQKMHYPKINNWFGFREKVLQNIQQLLV
jgi:hypothetical protein